MTIMPPDNRGPGSPNPPVDFDELDDVVGLILQFLAAFAGNSVSNNLPPPNYPSGNVQNLATLQQMVAGYQSSNGLAGSDIKIAQQGNERALTLAGLAGTLSDICQFLDPYGNVMFAVGIQGVYNNGGGFWAYDRYGCNFVALNPLGGGESYTGGGITNYAPGYSPLSGAVPSGGNTVNWMGVQDDWSGLDMDCYLPVTTTGTSGSSVTINTGACLVLNAPLTSGQNYSGITCLPVPGVIPNGATITLYNPGGSPSLFYAANSQVLTVSATANLVYGATAIPVTSFNANANYPSFNPQGNGYMETTVGIVTGTNAFPWVGTGTGAQLITETWPSGTAAGQVRTLRFKVPNKWFFNVSPTNVTVGILTAYAA